MRKLSQDQDEPWLVQWFRIIAYVYPRFINIEQCVWFCFHTTTRLKTDIIAKDQPGEKRQRAEKDVSKSRCWFPDIRSIVATKRFNSQYLHEASA